MSLLVLGGSVLAQQSASYRISDHAFNAAGHPDAGVMLVDPLTNEAVAILDVWM